MLIQKAIETNIVNALTTALAGVGGVDVHGSWETALRGLVKWQEDGLTSSPVYVSVSVGGPVWRAYSLDEATLQATIAVFVRSELDPTGETLVSVTEAVETVVRNWVATVDIEDTSLDATDFSVDAVSTSGSSAPAVNGGICSVAWPLTLSGSYRETTTTTNNQED